MGSLTKMKGGKVADMDDTALDLVLYQDWKSACIVLIYKEKWDR